MGFDDYCLLQSYTLVVVGKLEVAMLAVKHDFNLETDLIRTASVH